MNTHTAFELDYLIDQIRDEVRETSGMTGRRVLETDIMQVLRQVPREAFVPEDLLARAYANRPLPIGYGQTISQPYIVALMTDLIRPQAGDVVLEIGTGSGYQAAILSRLVKQVYSLEIVAPLAEQALKRLRGLGYDNVEVRTGNGHLGWPEHAPYDAILVTAAATAIPPALIEQLKPCGTLVIPVGDQYARQELRVVSKDAQGKVEAKNVLPVIFVPMTGNPGESAGRPACL